MAQRRKKSVNKKMEFEIEFVNDDQKKEDLRDIIDREFVKFVNEQKGFTYLTLKKK